MFGSCFCMNACVTCETQSAFVHDKHATACSAWGGLIEQETVVSLFLDLRGDLASAQGKQL